jgi:hypothetical protein
VFVVHVEMDDLLKERGLGCGTDLFFFYKEKKKKNAIRKLKKVIIVFAYVE